MTLKEQYGDRYPKVRANLLLNTNDSFVSTADDMLKEFIEKEGFVTCEFHTFADNLGDKMEFLSWHTCGLDSPYYWRVYYCSTCSKHENGEQSFHCELLREDY